MILRGFAEGENKGVSVSVSSAGTIFFNCAELVAVLNLSLTPGFIVFITNTALTKLFKALESAGCKLAAFLVFFVFL